MIDVITLLYQTLTGSWDFRKYASGSWLFTQQESYNTGDGTTEFIFGNTWAAQTFSSSAVSHSVDFVRLKMYRINSPGTVWVSIRAVDSNGHPTGSDLTSGSINGNNFTTSTSGDWYKINLTHYLLSGSSTSYSIVVNATSGNGTNYIRWRSTSTDTWPGNHEQSTDGGVTWTANTVADCMFEVWGIQNPHWVLKDKGQDENWPQFQILLDEIPNQKVEIRYVTEGVKAIKHSILVSVFVRPVQLTTSDLSKWNDTFRNMRTEVDRILTLYRLAVPNIHYVDLTHWEEITDRQKNPYEMLAQQVVECNYYELQTDLVGCMTFPFILPFVWGYINR